MWFCLVYCHKIFNFFLLMFCHSGLSPINIFCIGRSTYQIVDKTCSKRREQSISNEKFKNIFIGERFK